jgi:hypothetical protein
VALSWCGGANTFVVVGRAKVWCVTRYSPQGLFRPEPVMMAVPLKTEELHNFWSGLGMVLRLSVYLSGSR